MILKFAIEEFMADRDYRELAPRSIQSYRATLEEFLAYCTGEGVHNALDVTPQLVKGFLVQLKQKGNNPNSRNHKLHNLKTFFNYLTNDLHLFKESPLKKVEYAKTEDRLEVFTDKQVQQMLTHYRQLKTRDKAFSSYRNYTLIVTLLGTGFRLGELVNLRWENIDFKNSQITVYGKKRQFSSVPMHEKLRKELGDWQAFCRQKFGQLAETVFVDHHNRPTSENAVQNVFKRLTHKMGFRVNAHQFRHWFAKQWILNGGDVLTLQKILRHSNLSTTQRYVNLWGTALASQNDLYNPMKNV